MTPKQEAFELFKKYSISVEVYFKEDSIPRIVNAPMRAKSAKQCALIAVNELIESTFSVKWYGNNDIIPSDYLLTEYWQEVKKEIEKL